MIGLIVAIFHRKVDSMKASLVLGMSMIGSGVANVWQWLPSNIALLTGISGMALTWTLIAKNFYDYRKAKETYEWEKTERERNRSEESP
jgi:hypothetical protein